MVILLLMDGKIRNNYRFFPKFVAMEKFIVSARKYRPATFGTLIGQDSIATTLKNSIKRGQLAHAYLFCGPRGVGKTTTARIFAKIINCMNPGEDMEPCGQCESCKSFEEGRSYCIHELDAASNNSVDDIRALTEKVMIPPQIGKYSVYIIDEVHMLSTSAFNAFLKTLEEPPQHAIFILATTEKHKIIPTILSRCQVYDFNRISIPDIVKNLKMIAAKEEVQIDDGSLHVIAEKADGAMRDALTLFDQVVAYCGNTVDYASVIKNLNVLDYDYYFKLIDNSLEGKFADSLVLFDEVLSKGFNALYFVGGLGNHLRNLLICKETASAKLLEVSPELEVKYRQQSQRCPLKFLFKALAATEKCEGDYARSNNQRLLVEFMLVRLSQLVEQPAAKPEAPKPAPQPEKPAQPEKADGFAVQRMSEEKPQGPSVAQTEETSAAPPKEPEKPAEPIEAASPAAEPEPEKPAEPEKAEEPASLFSEPEKPAQPEPVEAPAEPEKADGFAVQRMSEEKPQGPSVVQTAQTAAAPAPAFAPGLSISSLMNEKKQEEAAEKKPLDFMGPSTGKPVTQEAVDTAWNKMVAMYEQKSPKLIRFIAMLKEAHPVLEEGTDTVAFAVSNSSQKAWIEQQTGTQMANFLRKALQNEGVKLAVRIKSREDIVKKMYMPQDKDRYLTENNPEFAQLKKDMGAELK